MQKIESREKLHELVEKDKKRLEARKNKIHEIVSNDVYIKWLERFTNKYDKFQDDEFFYDKKHLSDEDLDNVNNLSLFFDAINHYASLNYIYPKKEFDFTHYYQIKYNGIGYEIGVITGQGTVSFCERTYNITDEFIDFNDIMINKPQEKTEYFNKRLIELSSIIGYYYEQGIPMHAIEQTINNTLSDIKNSIVKEEDYKKLVKKYKGIR
ncbi:MAG: hypothetical protein IJ068_02050 [Bacilli bacterium]|nr:hypothetical protein [Bacilli bacterium]